MTTTGNPRTGQALADAATLETAAEVFRRRSRDPRAFFTIVICRVLERMAAQLREKAPAGDAGDA
jgi:hypothetical protein